MNVRSAVKLRLTSVSRAWPQQPERMRPNSPARFSGAIRGKHPVLLRTASVGDRSPAVDDDRLARNRVGGKERQDDLRDVSRL
jgi:hypothetical protein